MHRAAVNESTFERCWQRKYTGFWDYKLIRFPFKFNYVQVLYAHKVHGMDKRKSPTYRTCHTWYGQDATLNVHKRTRRKTQCTQYRQDMTHNVRDIGKRTSCTMYIILTRPDTQRMRRWQDMTPRTCYWQNDMAHNVHDIDETWHNVRDINTWHDTHCTIFTWGHDTQCMLH